MRERCLSVRLRANWGFQPTGKTGETGQEREIQIKPPAHRPPSNCAPKTYPKGKQIPAGRRRFRGCGGATAGLRQEQSPALTGRAATTASITATERQAVETKGRAGASMRLIDTGPASR